VKAPENSRFFRSRPRIDPSGTGTA
jgi:hypothetical protein